MMCLLATASSSSSSASGSFPSPDQDEGGGPSTPPAPVSSTAAVIPLRDASPITPPPSSSEEDRSSDSSPDSEHTSPPPPPPPQPTSETPVHVNAALEVTNDPFAFVEDEEDVFQKGGTGWRRLIVKTPETKNHWKVEYVSPDGKRLQPSKNLDAQLTGEGATPQVINGPDAPILKPAQAVKFSFISMKANIFDMKKRKAKPGRRKSVHAAPSSLPGSLSAVSLTACGVRRKSAPDPEGPSHHNSALSSEPPPLKKRKSMSKEAPALDSISEEPMETEAKAAPDLRSASEKKCFTSKNSTLDTLKILSDPLNTPEIPADAQNDTLPCHDLPIDTQNIVSQAQPNVLAPDSNNTVAMCSQLPTVTTYRGVTNAPEILPSSVAPKMDSRVTFRTNIEPSNLTETQTCSKPDVSSSIKPLEQSETFPRLKAALNSPPLHSSQSLKIMGYVESDVDGNKREEIRLLEEKEKLIQEQVLKISKLSKGNSAKKDKDVVKHSIPTKNLTDKERKDDHLKQNNHVLKSSSEITKSEDTSRKNENVFDNPDEQQNLSKHNDSFLKDKRLLEKEKEAQNDSLLKEKKLLEKEKETQNDSFLKDKKLLKKESSQNGKDCLTTKNFIASTDTDHEATRNLQQSFQNSQPSMLRALLEQRRKSAELTENNTSETFPEKDPCFGAGSNAILSKSKSCSLKKSPVKEVWTTSKDSKLIPVPRKEANSFCGAQSIKPADCPNSDKNCSILKALLQKQVLPRVKEIKSLSQSSLLPSDTKSRNFASIESPSIENHNNELKISNQSRKAEEKKDPVETDHNESISSKIAIVTSSPKTEDKHESSKHLSDIEKAKAKEEEPKSLSMTADEIPNSPLDSLPEAPEGKSEVTDEFLESRTPLPQLLIPELIPSKGQNETQLPPTEIICSTEQLPLTNSASKDLSSASSRTASAPSSRASSVPPTSSMHPLGLSDRPISADNIESPQVSFDPSRIKTKRHSRDFLNEGCEDEIASIGEDDDDMMAEAAFNCEQLVRNTATSRLVECLVNRDSGFKCSIPVVDMFYLTPLDSFLCYGCSQPYGSTNNFTIDLKDGTIDVICGQCKWWTIRKTATKTVEDSLQPTPKTKMVEAPPQV